MYFSTMVPAHKACQVSVINTKLKHKIVMHLIKGKKKGRLEVCSNVLSSNVFAFRILLEYDSIL